MIQTRLILKCFKSFVTQVKVLLFWDERKEVLLSWHPLVNMPTKQSPSWLQEHKAPHQSSPSKYVAVFVFNLLLKSWGFQSLTHGTINRLIQGCKGSRYPTTSLRISSVLYHLRSAHNPTWSLPGYPQKEDESLTCGTPMEGLCWLEERSTLWLPTSFHAGGALKLRAAPPVPPHLTGRSCQCQWLPTRASSSVPFETWPAICTRRTSWR